MTARTVAIAGAYGYLGSVLRASLERAGWRTVALVRRPRPNDHALAWSLEDSSVPEGTFHGVAALLHCAYDLRPLSLAESLRVNAGGTRRLLAAAEFAGVERVVVLSSMSAYAGSKQIYAQTKLAIEQATVSGGGIAIRPGLVYGGAIAGMGGTLTRLTRLPITPVPAAPGAMQFPVLEADLARWVVRILSSDDWLPEVISIAQPKPVSFPALLRALARQDGHGCHLLPIPWQAVFRGLLLAERLGVHLPLRSDSLLGLVQPATVVTRSRAYPQLLEDLAAIGG